MDENNMKPMLLNKETLRTLSESELSEANGGLTPILSFIIAAMETVCPITITIA